MARWHETIDVSNEFHSDKETKDKIKDITNKMKMSRHYRENNYFSKLVDKAARAKSGTAFDKIWQEIYDHCDAFKIWLNTM